MGKRKERRLAAMSNAGRRFKLDLFAEPSGDLGGSIVHEKVEGDPKDSAELPNSPTSSVQQPQNPLLLLGQYSDDDLDEELDERLNHATAESSSTDQDDMVEAPPAAGNKDVVDYTGEELVPEMVDQPHMERNSTPLDANNEKEDGDDREIDAVLANHKEMDPAEPISVVGTSETHLIGDVSSSWKIVMHEESNQHYYWNTETGETSWEVPDVLARTTELSSDHKIPVTENVESAPVGMGVELDNGSAELTMGSTYTGFISQGKAYDSGPQMTEWVEGYESGALKDKSWVPGVSRSEFQNSLDAVNAPSNHGALDGSENSLSGVLAGIEHTSEIDLSSRLVKHSEFLLERLKSLKGSEGNSEGLGKISKYILEVEIRLSDINALLSYGSSLHPFWVHTERQLKHLEDAINDEVYQLAKSAVMDDVDANHIASLSGNDISHESIRSESEADGNKSNVSFPTETSHVCTDVASYRDAGSQLNVTVLPEDTIPKSGFHAGEDVDMDVDMEVEDADPAGSTATENVAISNNFAIRDQSNIPADNPSLGRSDASTVPPPPDEEWIPPPPPDNEPVPPPPPDSEQVPPPPPDDEQVPHLPSDNEQVPPPPPDNEQIPPPPPDELSEPSYPLPPSYTEPGQPVSYTEQYNLAYLNPNFQYYAPAVIEVPSSNFYGHGDGSEVAMPHASLYYGVVPNTCGETAAVMVNAIEPVAYYDFRDGTVPPVPADSNTVSSQFNKESGPFSYNAIAMGSLDAAAVEGHIMKGDVSTVRGETEMATAGVPSTSTTIQAPSSISVKENVYAPSTDVATASVAVSSSSAKIQSKVLRSKKRTVVVAPSLRSNKKVSGLVDKWKAAKEELNENDEDEPENAIEILERKRQREIEEWHAKQIASGEAKDNANFQPLGGDWREKVKRRRAQAAREAAETAPEKHRDENQQPNLTELLKDLPSGWQAYWDETSKQVYYGNALTSETTWTRPTK